MSKKKNRQRKIEYVVESWVNYGGILYPRTKRKAIACFNSMLPPASVFRFERKRSKEWPGRRMCERRADK